jgi:hypothetical protein
MQLNLLHHREFVMNIMVQGNGLQSVHLTCESRDPITRGKLAVILLHPVLLSTTKKNTKYKKYSTCGFGAIGTIDHVRLSSFLVFLLSRCQSCTDTIYSLETLLSVGEAIVRTGTRLTRCAPDVAVCSDPLSACCRVPWLVKA